MAQFFMLLYFLVVLGIIFFLITLAIRLVRAQEQSALYLLELTREIKKITTKDQPKD